MQEKNGKVSVCVATYNQEKYIKDCIMSVLAQQHNVDLEVLVGDDSSKDQTPRIVRSIADRFPRIVKVFAHSTNLGASKNYRFLVEHSTGDYIAHLDGDDFWLPGKLESQVKFMEAHSTYSAVYTNALVVDKDCCRLEGIFNNTQPVSHELNYLLSRGNYLNHSSILYRASLKNEVVFGERESVDYRVHCRLAMKGPLGYINRPLVGYRNGAETSALLHSSEEVRERTWNAILEVGQSRLTPKAWSGAVQRFMAGIVWSSIRRKDPTYALKWGRRISADLKSTQLKIMTNSMIGFVGYSAYVARAKITQKISKNSIPVLCWR